MAKLRAERLAELIKEEISAIIFRKLRTQGLVLSL